MKRLVGIRLIATSKSTRSLFNKIVFLSLTQAGSLILGTLALTELIQSTTDGVSIFAQERVWLSILVMSFVIQVIIARYLARFIWDQSNAIIEDMRMQVTDSYLGHANAQPQVLETDDFIEQVVEVPQQLKAYLNTSLPRGLDVISILLLTLVVLATLLFLQTPTDSILLFAALIAVALVIRVRDLLQHPPLATPNFEPDIASTQATANHDGSEDAEEVEASTSMGRIKELRWTDGEILLADEQFVTFPWGIASSGKLTVIKGLGNASKRALIEIIVGSQVLHRGRLFIDTSKGVFRADEWDHSELRKKIAWLSQSPHFVRGTIEENLRLTKPRASREKLKEILLEVGLDDVALPEGLKTNLDPSELHVSAEQLRRLALARVLLKGAPIVIVEDVNSPDQPDFHLLLQRVLKNLSREGTLVICVSEDEDLQKIADRLITIDSEQITPTFVVEAAQ